MIKESGSCVSLNRNFLKVAGLGLLVIVFSLWGRSALAGSAIFGDILSWVSVSNFPVAMGAMGGSVVNGRIYAMGGYNYGWYSSVYSWDPSISTQGWTSVSSLPEPRGCFESVSVGGKIYAIGGRNDIGHQKSVYVYDTTHPELGWGSVSNLPLALAGSGPAVVQGVIYMIGGESTNGNKSEVYKYDPAQPEQGWQYVNNLPVPIGGTDAVVVNDIIYVTGGISGGVFLSTVWGYDPAHSEQGWFSISNMPVALSSHATVSVNGKAYVVGGYRSGSIGVNTVYMYDPGKPGQGWLSLANLPTAKSEAPGVVVNGKIYVIAGATAPLTYTPTVYEGSFSSGVSPSSVTKAGGTTVTIRGSDLGNGSNITSVTLCGVPASIISQSATQLVVISGVSAIATTGAVVVSSASTVIAVASNAFSYVASLPVAPGILPATLIAKQSFSANWTAVGGVDCYCLDVAAVSNFSICLSGLSNLNVGTVITYPVSGLNAGSTYYYRVRSQQGGISSSNSATMSAKTSPQGVIFGDILRWSSVSNFPIARGAMGGGVVNGRIYAMGGYNYGWYSAVYSWDPSISTQGWSSVSALPETRGCFEGVSVGGKLYSIGGRNDNFQKGVYVYDAAHPELGWGSVSNLPLVLAGCEPVVVQEVIYVIGGESTNGAQTAVYKYNPAWPEQGWQLVNHLPSAAIGIAAAVVNDIIYVTGGVSNGVYLSTAWGYDPSHPEQGWFSISNMPAARYAQSTVGVNGKIYAVGGYNASEVCVNTVYVYDPSKPAQGWQSAANMPNAKGEAPGVVVNGKIYVIAGATAPLTYTPTVYEGSFSSGVSPSSGTKAGGTTVTIRGSDLGNGSNITSVTLCGVPASIISQSATQLVVISGVSAIATTGAVVVSSASTGITVASNAFSYLDNYWLGVSNAVGGTLSGVSGWYGRGTNVVITATPSNGYHFVGWLGTTNGCIASGSQLLVPMTQGRYITGIFELIPYLVAASAGEGGGITPRGSVVVPCGFSTNFTIHSVEGFHIARVLVDGQSVGEFAPGSNTFNYTFANVTTNHSIRATFNSAPVIKVSVDPLQGVAPLRVKFDLSSSADLEDNIVRSEVDRNNDGMAEWAAEGKAVLIGEYSAPGIYTNTLKVIDGFGLMDSTSVVVTVWGQAPKAILEATPVSGPAPLTVSLVGTSSTFSVGHRIVVYEWDFDGDGSYDQISQGGLVSHVYRASGTFTAMLRVTDDQGLQDKASMNIVVAPPTLTAPSVTVQATPGAGAIPLPVTFVALVSNETPMVEYKWDFDGDGIMDLRTTSGTAIHTYSKVGTYLVSVTAVDTNGLSGKATVSVTAREASNLRVWIVQPKLGDKVSGNAVSVNANAVPASQVAWVQLQYRQNSGVWLDIGSPIVPPPADFKATWCVTNLVDGTVCDLKALAMDNNGNSVTSEVVSVTIDASAGNVPGSGSEGDKDGKHTKQATFSTNETALVEVYDGTSVMVPLGAVESNVTVEVVLTGTNTNPDVGLAYGQANIQMNRTVSLEGHPDLKNPITITIPYPDDNNDGIVDGTCVPESTLQAYWFDTTDGQWKRPLSCEVNTSANYVKITTYHLTEFGLYGSRNLLLAVNGGVLNICSFTGTNATSVASLTDGNTASYWLSPTNPGPQEFVYGFTNWQGAICSEVVIYNYGQAGQGLTNYSRDYQIWGAMDIGGTNFFPLTNGVLPASEGPVVIGLGNVTCRVIKLVITSGYNSQWGLAEFELHGSITADPNGNGMSDAWEMQYFGCVERTGLDDYDADALNDLNEFIHSANPMTNDTDGDGMTDGWEVQYGFQVVANDAADDSDGDGMSNIQEYIAGTNPTNSQSSLKITGPLFDGPWSTNVFWAEGHWRTCNAGVVWYDSQWVTQKWMNAARFIMEWEAVSGRTYRLYSTTNLLGTWQTNSPGISGKTGHMSFSNDLDAVGARFFRLDAEQGP